MFLSLGEYVTVPAASLSCIVCIWLFFRYFKQPQKSIGFTMIVILALSDFIYSIIFLLRQFIGSKLIEEDLLYYIPFSLCLYFSIFWASTIAYLVYKSLQGKDYNIKNGLKLFTLIVLLLSIIFTAM